MKARLLASSHRIDGIGLAPAPSLDEALHQACREQHRRIDRFIQLALLGAARCAGGRPLDPSTALYLGSGVGPAGNNIIVQEQICRDKVLPRPFNFVNTLGSSATFFVAKELGLEGQGWWVARRGATFEALLELALTDLELGIAPAALVGVAEECPQPVADQRRRLGVKAETPLAEGSHWLLLEKGGGPESLEAEFELQGEALLAALALRWRPEDAVAFGPSVPPELRAELARGRQEFTPAFPGEHDSAAAAFVTDFLENKGDGRLHLVAGLAPNHALISVTPKI
jgi:hypothetical protein